MRIVGLTGGIACGKSMVSTRLRELGFLVLDADAVAHAVVEPVSAVAAAHALFLLLPLAVQPCTPLQGRWGYRRVVTTFGPEVLRPDGQLDREVLAELVFTHPSARRRLNQATHPAVGLELARQLLWAWLRGKRVLVVDMPLLFESGAWRLCSLCVLVTAGPELQLARLMARDGLPHDAAAARVAAQMPLEEKRRRADMVLQNDGSLEELQGQVGGWQALTCGSAAAAAAAILVDNALPCALLPHRWTCWRCGCAGDCGCMHC